MKARVIVTAIIQKGNKILLGQKPKDVGPYPNTWHLPGGGVDLEDETLEKGLIREIKEETGIKVKNIQRHSFDEDYEPRHGEMMHLIFLVYTCDYLLGEVKANDDIEELKWFDKKDLSKISLTRPSIKLFKEIGWI